MTCKIGFNLSGTNIKKVSPHIELFMNRSNLDQQENTSFNFIYMVTIFPFRFGFYWYFTQSEKKYPGFTS